MIEPIATNVFLLNLVGDVCGSLAAPVGRRRRLRVDSGACGSAAAPVGRRKRLCGALRLWRPRRRLNILVLGLAALDFITFSILLR